MKTVSLAVLALSAVCLLAAADDPLHRIQLTSITHVDFPAGGTLHLKNSAGEVTIEAWDGPDIEMTTVKTSPIPNDAPQRDRDRANQLLQAVQVSTAKTGDEVLITTVLPHHHHWLFPWGAADYVDLDYRLKVPRNARLIVEHGAGEVHIYGMANDIKASVRDGLLSLEVPKDGQYAIKAHSSLGDVVSDFDGEKSRQKFRMSHGFTGPAASSGHELNLHIRFGDIMIRKAQ